MTEGSFDPGRSATGDPSRSSLRLGPVPGSLSPVFTTLARMTDVPRQGWGWGLATIHASGSVLDVFYPEPRIGGEVTREAPDSLLAAQFTDDLRHVTTKVVCVVIDLDTAPEDTEDAYLRLHLLSHRLVQPHGLNLEGIFSKLPNNAWTSHGPVRVEDVACLRTSLRAQGETLLVFGVDKFPRMTDYVVPAGVRIGDADRVRLGAHLASGTTVMHEGFVNFNAGTLGTSMVEGRISAGVVVGDGSDIGGGASIMGTLSGGGKEVIRIGERCLLGAESGVGISLGDDCIVEAGLYVTAGTKVELPDGRVVKARELSGVPGLLFLRDSQSGKVVVKPRQGSTVELNDELHAN